ncbi:retinol-binding protein pinta-like [Ctenocephalides felis]|uniref:retinol-binding protein pinta-like n=1 Tax=Ctenocephalides felis TaxID=7515 RepID=UPI000E6E402F|nr:retinol-binding protein pinta-like [Ctenocephalides felis]
MSELYKCTLSAEDYLYAEEYLGETESIRNDSIREIQEWIQDNPHIKARNDPVSILHFLRGCKFDIPKTIAKIKHFYLARSKVPEWYQNRDPHLCEIQELVDLGVFLPLKTKDAHNRLIVVIKAAAHDPKKHLQDDVFKIGQMIMDLALHLDESVSVYGVVAIFDLENVTLGHALQLHPGMIKKLVDSWKFYPTMVKRLDFVNAPSFVNIVLDVFMKFMTKKLRDRVTVHRTGLLDIPGLPEECVKNPKMFFKDLTNYWKEQLNLYRDWLKNDMSTNQQT